MAKTLKTRIKNRYDSLTNWSKTGVELLPGEIALVSVTTQQIDESTGNVINVPAVLLKVGESDGNGGTKAFSELPWLSAIAADVYDWAKNEHAKDISVAVTTGSGSGAKTETKTLGAWLKATLEADATNAAAISDVSGKVDVAKVSTAISSAIDTFKQGLVHTGNAGTNQIVKAVTQANGKVTVTYGAISTNELPEITTDLIKFTGFENLTKKIADMDSKIAGFKGEISATPSGSGNYVRGVSYSNGVITVTKGDLVDNDVTTAKINAKAVTTAKIADGAVTETQLGAGAVTTAKIADGNVTDAKIDTVSASKVIYTPGTDPVTLPEKIAEVEGRISSIDAAIAGGVNFRGETNAAPTVENNKTYAMLKAKPTDTEYTKTELTAGSIVIYIGSAQDPNDSAKNVSFQKEYISTGAAWQELGDLSRVGTLETWRGTLDYTTTNAVASTHKFASQVTQADGKIAVTYTQPAATDITYSDSTNNTVAKAIAANASAAADALAAAQHSHNSYVNQNAFSNIKVGSTTVAADTTTDTVEFVGSNITITPDATNDKVTFAVADGTTSAKGIVKLSDTYTGAVAADGSDSKTAATTKAVKLAYAAAVTADGKGADAQARVEVVENNYIQAKKSGDTYTAMVGEDTIIFDCGGADL